MITKLSIFLCFGIALGAVGNENEVYKGSKSGKCSLSLLEMTSGITETVAMKIGKQTYDSINYGTMYVKMTGKQDRKAMTNIISVDFKTGKETIVYIWQLGLTQYTAIPATKTCTKIQLPEAIVSMWTNPKNTTYLGTRRYGGRLDGMKTEVWFANVEKDGIKAQSVATFSHRSCTLNTVVARMDFPTGPVEYQMEFYDVIKKVKDPSVFDLPDYCKKTEAEGKIEEHLKYL